MESQQQDNNSQPINSQLEDFCVVIEDDLSRIRLLNKGFEAESKALKKETELLVEFIQQQNFQRK